MSTQREDRDRMFEQAHLLRQKGDLGGAIELFFELLARDVRDHAVARDLASLLAQDEQPERAERVFRHALKLTGDDPALSANYGAFLGQSGRLAESRLVLQGLREKLLERLAADQPLPAEEQDELYEGLAICTLNLAATLLEQGERLPAWRLAEPYLQDPGHWDRADSLLCRAAEELGEDLLTVARRLHAAKKASPLMVWQVLEAVAVDTHDPVAAARVLVKGSTYLPGRLLLDAIEGDEVLQPLARSLDAELTRLAPGDRTARRLLHKVRAIAQEDLPAAEDPGPPGATAPDAPRQLSLPLRAAREVKRPTPTWKHRPMQQVALQFGSDDLPLFAAAQGRTTPRSTAPLPQPVQLPALTDHDFWMVSPRYWMPEEQWLEAMCSLARCVFGAAGAQGETLRGLMESGIPGMDSRRVIEILLGRGDLEQVDERGEDDEPRFRVPAARRRN